MDPPFEPKLYGRRCLPAAVDINRLIIIMIIIIVMVITHATETNSMQAVKR